MSLVEQIQKFVEGSSKGNKNIHTSDNKLAYITSTGLAKPYASLDSYEKTAGQNGCPRSYLTLTEKWDSLGYASGTQMQTGQSCGKEGTFLQSSVPDTKFDANYYLQSHPELKTSGILNKQQAYDHWKKVGSEQGWSPHPQFDKQIQSLGKVGYIDLDTQLHEVSNDAYVYDGNYTMNKSTMIGRSMVSCSGPIPLLIYGSPVLLKKDNTYASTQNNTVTFSSSKQTWYIQPIDLLNKNTPVLYGDVVVLTNTLDCGTGCSVGYYNQDTHTMMVGPSTKGNTFHILPPPNTPYTNKGQIKLGDPFLLQYTPEADQYEYKDIEKGRDTGGNDIKSYKYTTTEQCKAYCEETPNCAGYVHAPYSDNCWLKTNKMYPIGTSNYKLNDNRNITIRTQLLPKKASVQQGIVVFQDAGDLFTTMPPDDTLSSRCDLNELQKECNIMGKDCIGFVHSPATQTWQPLKPNPTGSIKLSDTTQAVYLKNANTSLTDCPTNVNWVDASQFSNYVKGEEFKAGVTGQCKPMDVNSLTDRVKEFREQGKQQLEEGKQKIQQYNEINSSTHNTYQQLATQYNKGEKQLKEYRTAKKSMKHITKNPTSNQSVTDSEILGNYYHTNSILWGVGSAVIIIAVIASRKL